MIMVSMIATISATNRKTSCSKVVKPVFGSLASLAMRPKTVKSPVETTTATAFPETQWVP
jgi:hypothetical protein